MALKQIERDVKKIRDKIMVNKCHITIPFSKTARAEKNDLKIIKCSAVLE